MPTTSTWAPLALNRTHLLYLAAITGLAATLRLPWLDRIPGGLFFDVAANLFDVLDIHDGAHAIWFPRNNGREPLVLYLQALTALAIGSTAMAAKLATALLGIATVPAAYLLGRETAGALDITSARRVGLVTALLTATMYWHVHFSRLGLRTIALPLFIALTLALLLRAARNNSPAWALAAGAAGGVAMYTYTASRLLPLGVLPCLVLLRPRIGSAFTIAWLIVAAPLALYYVDHSEEMGARQAAVSVLNPEIGRGDPLGAAARGLLLTAAATIVRGSESPLENLPGRPLLEPLTGSLLLVGLAWVFVWLVRGPPLARLSAAALLLTLGAMALSPALRGRPEIT